MTACADGAATPSPASASTHATPSPPKTAHPSAGGARGVTTTSSAPSGGRHDRPRRVRRRQARAAASRMAQGRTPRLPLPPHMEPRRAAVGTPRRRHLRKAPVMTGLRVVSWGGGVQSTAMLVLAAQNRIPFRTFLFSNVGDDSENPDTLTYYRDTALPYAKAAGLDLI